MSVQTIVLTILVSFCYSSLNADSSSLWKETPSVCMTLLEDFAKEAADFTLCSIQHARPIRLCEACITNYVNFSKKYDNLINNKTLNNGTSCKDIYLSKDRLDAVLEYHNNIKSIWDKGHCCDCFDWSGSSPVLSNQTNNFIQLFNEINECLNKDKDVEDICEKCMKPYSLLDNFYKSMSVDAIGVDSICMDVVDMMNSTRSTWSKDLNCCKLRKTPEVVFLCCTAIISLLPILFYLAVRYCGPIRDLPNALNQSRFKQSFQRSGNSHRE